MFSVRGTLHATVLFVSLLSIAGSPVLAQVADPIADAPAVDDGGAIAWPVVADPNVDPVVFAVSQRLAETSVAKSHHRDDVAVLTQFYKSRTDGTLWIDDEGFSSRARAAKSELSVADNWGLEAAHYKLPSAPTANATPDQKAEAEIAFGLTVLKYARHARQGRVRPASVTRINDFPGLSQDDVGEMWRDLAKADDIASALRGVHPQYPQFELLRQALLKARGVTDITTGALPEERVSDSDDDATKITLPKGDDITVGMQHKDIVLLRQRLAIDADVGSNPQYFDAPLAEAVQEFQIESGLVATGNLDGVTRKRLNAVLLDAEVQAAGTASPSDDQSSSGTKKSSREIQLILNNMERWRWMPDDLGKLYVWNNVPEFRTRVFKGEKTVFSEKIIVGLSEWATPSFMADMKFIVFHPSWGVPRGIKLKELLPRLKRAQPQSLFDFFGGGGGTGAVFRAYNLEVYKNGQKVNPNGIKWNSSNILSYSFVQPAGKKNPLGIVKFRFPNKHNVYMHDTIERELFAKSSRAYSHGCIRVRDPIKLAAVLLEHDQGMASDSVRRRARSGGSVSLQTDVPVYVTYMTARVDEDGNLRTYGDLYGRDGRLARQLGRSMRFEQPKVAKPKSSSTRKQTAPKKRKKKKKSASSNRRFPSSMSQTISGRYN